MLRNLFRRLTYANVMSSIAVFGVLAGGTAYAANTIRSSDIVDNEITTTDVRDDSLGFGGLFHQDLASGSVRGSEIQDGAVGVDDIGSQQVGSDEVVNDSLLQSDIRAGAVTGDEVLDNSLTGTDINESTFNLPPTTTATFVGVTGGNGTVTDAFKKVASRFLPAGSYAVTATANLGQTTDGADIDRDAQCELRNGADFIGGALDRRTDPRQPSDCGVAVDERRSERARRRRRSEPLVQVSGRLRGYAVRPDDDPPPRRVLLAALPRPRELAASQATRSVPLRTPERLVHVPEAPSPLHL